MPAEKKRTNMPIIMKRKSSGRLENTAPAFTRRPMEKKKNEAKSELNGFIFSSILRDSEEPAIVLPARNAPTEKESPMESET